MHLGLTDWSLGLLKGKNVRKESLLHPYCYDFKNRWVQLHRQKRQWIKLRVFCTQRLQWIKIMEEGTFNKRLSSTTLFSSIGPNRKSLVTRHFCSFVIAYFWFIIGLCLIMNSSLNSHDFKSQNMVRVYTIFWELPTSLYE